MANHVDTRTGRSRRVKPPSDFVTAARLADQSVGSQDSRGPTRPSESHSSSRPVLRWAGGKTRLLPQLVSLLPSVWGRYVEPMVGSGALFFRLSPGSGLVGDINDDLVNFYSILRRDHRELYRALCCLPASRATYYGLRASKDPLPFARAVRFAYLNRLCWNGLYRVNRSGQFNVPIGDRLPHRMWFEDRLAQAADVLRRVTLASGDVENTLRHVRTGDLVYIDPPYRRGAADALGFNRYHRVTFGLEDHLRIADSVRTLTRMRVKVMLTLGGSSRVLRLYPRSLNRLILTTTALISGNGNARRAVREVVARNYT